MIKITLLMMNKEVLLALLYQRFPILFGPLKSSNFYLPSCCWCPDQPMQSCDGENANKRFRVYDFALFGSWLSAKCPHWGLWEQICNSDLWLGIILEWRFLDVGVLYSNQIGVVVAASNAYQHKIHPSGCLYLFHCLMPLKACMHNVYTLCKC